MVILNSSLQYVIDDTLKNTVFNVEKLFPDNAEFYKFRQVSGFMHRFIKNSDVSVEYDHSYSFFDKTNDVLHIHFVGQNLLIDLPKDEFVRVANAICYVASTEERFNWINKPIDGLLSYNENVQLLVAMFTVSLIFEKYDLYAYQAQICHSLKGLNDNSEMSLIAKMAFKLFDYLNQISSENEGL